MRKILFITMFMVGVFSPVSHAANECNSVCTLSSMYGNFPTHGNPCVTTKWSVSLNGVLLKEFLNCSPSDEGDAQSEAKRYLEKLVNKSVCIYL
jgi:hypothetical protein